MYNLPLSLQEGFAVESTLNKMGVLEGLWGLVRDADSPM